MAWGQEKGADVKISALRACQYEIFDFVPCSLPLKTLILLTFSCFLIRRRGKFSSVICLPQKRYVICFQSTIPVFMSSSSNSRLKSSTRSRSAFLLNRLTNLRKLLIAMKVKIMSQNDKIQLFEDKRIRTAWDEEKEEWYFSIVDVVAVLTDSPNPQTYWRVLKKRLKDEGNETVTSCNALKMTAADGKRRLTYVADTEQFLRIVQSIPSPKAEPFRAWLAQVGRERIEETIDPELTIEKALETYLKKGYTREWINQRMQAIQVRKELTDERDARGVQKGVEYAILTDEISRAWSGMSTRQYKNLKGLKKKNHRDNMTTLELVLNMLAEATTTEIPNQKAPSTFSENIAVAREGGEAAGIARKAVEERTGVPVITSKNAAQLNQVVTDLLEGAAADMSEMPEKK